MSEEQILINTPYPIKTPRQASKIIKPEVLEQMKQNIDHIALDSICTLSRRTLQKPVYLLNCRKLRHKETGQIIEVVEDSKKLGVMYDYVQMGDFQCRIEKQTKEDVLIKQLKAKAFGKKPKLSTEGMELVMPSLLREFNFMPPKKDLFSNQGKKPKNLSIVSQSIAYGGPVPSKPLRETPTFIQESALFLKISEYLQRRPCWLRNVLLTQLKQDGFSEIKQYEFKNCLRYLCYTFKNGPWKSIYCGFGYNPLHNHKAVIYQHVSAKLKKKEAEDYEQEISQDLYDPTFVQVSRRCSRGYQLCDINDEKIKQILNERLFVEDGFCCKEYGWLSRREHGNIAKIMKAKLSQQEQ